MTRNGRNVRKFSSVLACLLVASTVCLCAQTPDATPKKQLPADERAFKAARSTADPEKRLAAMRNFIQDFPKSSARVGRAQMEILTVLLDSFPDRASEIDTQARLIVKNSGKGFSLLHEENYVGFVLAEAGTSGVDLPYAEKIAKDALKHLSEQDYDKDNSKMAARYKMPPPKPAELHAEFANTRAEALAVLADVYLRRGKPGDQVLAESLVKEAYGLDPLVDDVNSQRGRLALLAHDNALALESFERAELVGAVSRADRAKTMELYRAAHSGSDAGFTAEMDALYAKLYPPAFTPEKAKPAGASHTILLELFTGSACGPCVGGDLAVEGLLAAYPRTEVVALAFDQHIPEPDPLANPDSVARGNFYDIGGTPSYVIDGKTQPMYGAERDGSKTLYDELVKAVDAEVGLSTGVALKLSVTAEEGQIQAKAIVSVPAKDEIAKTLAPKPKAESPAGSKPEAKAAAPSTVPVPVAPAAAVVPVAPHLVVNFALVEDDVRYSGENGIRFHRMVVRALAKPAESGFPLEATDAATEVNFDASFDPDAISHSLASYLDSYEQQNDRFGKVKFIAKDTTMQPGHLAIAAWVQDTVSHRILQAAFVPLSGSSDQAVAVSHAGGR